MCILSIIIVVKFNVIVLIIIILILIIIILLQTNISRVNMDVRQPHEIFSIENTWLFCLFFEYFCTLRYLVLNGTLKSVCACMEVGGGGMFFLLIKRD